MKLKTLVKDLPSMRPILVVEDGGKRTAKYATKSFIYFYDNNEFLVNNNTEVISHREKGSLVIINVTNKVPEKKTTIKKKGVKENGTNKSKN